MTTTYRHRLLAATTGIVLTAGLLAVSPAPATAAKPRADLVTTAVSAPASVIRGSTATLRLGVRNRGRRAAPRSTAGWYLSMDRAWSAGDRLLGSVAVPRLRPRAKATRTATVRVPAATVARDWWVVACADSARRVREMREGNNCRSAARLRVTVAPVDPPDPPVDPPVPVFPMEPDPLTVGEAHLQTDHAVTATAYSHEESVITTTADDGTTYTLTVPAEALIGPEPITMTPVSSVDGLPLSGGLVAGVQLEPHGLMLLKPAELVIESPDAGPLPGQTAFLFHEDGADFHLYPMQTPRSGDDADVVRLGLTHFSTPGLGRSTEAERSELASRIPVRSLSQARLMNEALLRGERAAQLAGRAPDPAVMRQVAAILNSYFDGVVRAQLVAAESDADLAAEAIAAGLAWSREAQLLGDTANPRHDEVMERVERILRHVLTQRWADCQAHDLRAILDLFRLARAAALMHLAWAPEARDKMMDCAHFEIRFESLITSVGSYSGTLQSGWHEGRWATTATVDVGLFEQEASGTLSYRDFAWSSSNTIHDADPDCTSTTVGTATAPGRLWAMAVPLLPSLNAVEGAHRRPTVEVANAVSVLGGASEPLETYRRTPCNGPAQDQTEARWAGHFRNMRPDTMWETDPEQQRADFLDIRTWESTVGSEGQERTERTEVEVWHRPRL